MKTFELRRLLIDQQMRIWNDHKYNIDKDCKWTINPDNSVDIEGTFHIPDILVKLPFKIRRVSENLTFTIKCLSVINDFENFPDYINHDDKEYRNDWLNCFSNYNKTKV